MNIDKSKLKHGLWYEDADGNYIPSSNSVSAPENAVTACSCFPLEVRTEHYSLHDYDGIRTYHGSDRIFATSVHIGCGNQDVIIAMVTSGDYTLSEALAVYASCCERCANALAYKYTNGSDGYPEYSDDWRKANTVCDFCKDMPNVN